jgi:hypothetical protein
MRSREQLAVLWIPREANTTDRTPMTAELLRSMHACLSRRTFPLRVIYAPASFPLKALRHELLLGLSESSSAVASDRSPHEGLCLTHKTRIGGRGRSHPSTASLVAAASDDDLRVWREFFGVCASSSDPEPDEAHWHHGLRGMSLYVDDASPDTVASLLLFLLKVTAGSDLPSRFVDYVTRWEQGDMTSTGRPFESLGALLSATAHRHFGTEAVLSYFESPPLPIPLPPPPGAAGNRAAPPPQLFRAIESAWMDSLGLLVEAVLADCDPSAMPSSPIGPFHAQASSHLRYEESVYAQHVRSGRVAQLSLPILGSNRRLLVDAFIGSERAILGAMKSFLQHDTSGAPLGRGFSLRATYRPHMRGSGNDIVITADPTLGVSLRSLWRTLEERENAAWSGARPCDLPRKDLGGYPDGLRDDGRPSPTEPWYDGGRGAAAETIIAAPRFVCVNGRYEAGSKLTFDEVVEALWSEYHPLSAIIVGNAGEARPMASVLAAPGDIHNVESEPSGLPIDARILIAADWHAGVSGAPFEAAELARQSFQLAPTVTSEFAAILRQRRLDHLAGHAPPHTPHQFATLPMPTAYDVIPLDGGIAVVSVNGAFILDDWTAEHPNIEELREEFRRACERLRHIREAWRLLGSSDMSETRVAEESRDRLGQRIAALEGIQLRLQQTLALTRRHSLRTDVIAFRESIERRWGIAGEIDMIYSLVERRSLALTRIASARSAARIRALTIVGLPVSVACSLFAFAFQRMPDPLGVWLLGATKENEAPVHLTAIVVAVSVCGIAIGCLKAWSSGVRRGSGDASARG